jgi:hypothetical protein
LDCFASAIARWNNSQRCFVSSFFKGAKGDSMLTLFSVIPANFEVGRSVSLTINVLPENRREPHHSLMRAGKPAVLFLSEE